LRPLPLRFRSIWPFISSPRFIPLNNITCEPFKISEISRIVFSSSDRPYRASYLIVLPSGSHIVSHDLVDKLDVDQSALEIKPYFLKKAQIFVYLVCGQGLFLCADPLKILIFCKLLPESLECLNLEALPLAPICKAMRQ